MASDAAGPAPGTRAGPSAGLRRSSGWTTRRWLGMGAAFALTVLAGLVCVGAWMLHRSAQVTDHLVNHSSPALLQAVRLEAALVNQETGIRGYGLTGQRSFLQPYEQGLSDERDAVAALRTDIAGDVQGQRQLAAVLSAAQAWQQLIADPVSAAPPATAIALATQRADAGLQAFNHLRDVSSAQQDELQADRAASAADLRRVSDLTDVVFAAIAAAVVLLVGLTVEGLRRGVTAPLGRLSNDAAQVANGDFDHEISPTGPADLRLLAEGVEAMRRRLADELLFADEARDRLDEQAGELRRSNAELEQFAYVASHDLQEPLRKVASFCQLLQRRYAGQLDERADQYIAFAVDGATRMQTLINDLLDFSRVGRLHADRVPVDLEKSLADTLDVLSLTIAETGAEIEHDPLPTVPGDPTQLGVLMQNLLSNALKFRSPDRPPRIRVEARRDGGLWQFAVADNGIGIGPEYAERVFTIFQRLHTREAYPGNGIGLALCKKIVEFHGGTIAVDPLYTPGARITFSLSAGDAAERGPGRDSAVQSSAGRNEAVRNAAVRDDGDGAEAPAGDGRAPAGAAREGGAP